MSQEINEQILSDWKEDNEELYSKFRRDLEEQLKKPYYQTILDIGDDSAEPKTSPMQTRKVLPGSYLATGIAGMVLACWVRQVRTNGYDEGNNFAQNGSFSS